MYKKGHIRQFNKGLISLLIACFVLSFFRSVTRLSTLDLFKLRDQADESSKRIFTNRSNMLKWTEEVKPVTESIIC